MKKFQIKRKVKKFAGTAGWYYVDVPNKYTEELKEKRVAWGMYPIEVTVGETTWNTKLMMKKGGDFFIALKASVRKKENVEKGDLVSVHCNLL